MFRSLLDSALAYWTVDPEINKHQIARTNFLKAKVLDASGNSLKASAALKLASRLRQEITKERRDPASLTIDDFQSIVTFWFR